LPRAFATQRPQVFPQLSRDDDRSLFELPPGEVRDQVTCSGVQPPCNTDSSLGRSGLQVLQRSWAFVALATEKPQVKKRTPSVDVYGPCGDLPTRVGL